MNPHLIDEILEAIWIAREEGKEEVSQLHVECQHDVGPINLKAGLGEMETQGLITVVNGRVTFTEVGQARARNLIRRHRLAKRLLMDVLDVSLAMSERMACEFEHILSQEVTDKVDAFLGYPTVDPNGRPIPAGDKPPRSSNYVEPLITRLSRLEVGTTARVAFMTPSFHKRFDRLVAFGINPGVEINLHQRRPAFVVRLGETELALDREIAEEIFVRPIT
jgi:DtxR family Mn-dependent transcriptional regulator